MTMTLGALNTCLGGALAGSSNAATKKSAESSSLGVLAALHNRPPAGQVTKVAIRDGKRISVNDHVYISAPWAPGAGEPYLIARVMEFVTASAPRSGAAALASSSGTLQVRVNPFLRTRDISHRISTDSRLLVATMHSDVYALDNVRGLCEVRHRDLLGDAPEVSAWKKREDHFYYYQLFDRYIHRFYDVIPTTKLQNAPAEVLDTLRRRYSFVVAEVGMAADLCDALRGCAVCQQWASATETVRCDTCKKFFHMRCLNPPLASKPAKGYSWTCAPCSRKHEQTVARELGSGPSGDLSCLPGNQGALIRGASNASTSSNTGSEIGHQVKLKTAISGRGGRPRGSGRRALEDATSAAGTPDGTPAPDRTLDDIRGTRCFNRWPYRYFGQHTNAPDVLDPHDSIYPRATTRLGPKYQASLPTWEEQKELGIGLAVGIDSDTFGSGAAGTSADDESQNQPPAPPGRGGWGGRGKRGRGRGRRGGAPVGSRDPAGAATAAPQDSETPGSTPTLAPASLPSDSIESSDSAGPPPFRPPASAPVREFERGTDESIDVICNVSTLGPGNEDKTALQDAYMTSAAWHFRPLAPYNLDFINRAVKVFNDNNYEPIAALQEVSRSTPEDFRIVHWTSRERKAFDASVKDWGSEMKHLKKLIPTKKVAEIVRYFVQWKNEKLKEQHAAERAMAEKVRAKGKAPPISERDSTPRSQTTTRAVSPALSIFEEKTVKDTPTASCKMCGTASSPFWYKGPWSWTNRFLCDSCGVYWRRYAAESTHPDLNVINSRKHAAPADENGSLGVAPPIKVAKFSSKTGDSIKSGLASVTTATESTVAATPPPVTLTAVVAAAAVSRPDPIRCVLCRKLEPKRRLQQCRQCSLSVHQGCFGLTDEEVNAAIWLCDSCTNEKTLDAALIPRCILCPPLPSQQVARRGIHSTATDVHSSLSTSTVGGTRGRSGKSGASAGIANLGAVANGSSSAESQDHPLTALEAVKPTECNNWAHLICAAWMPDVVFTDPKRMKLVEGAGNLAWWRYNATCEVCNLPGGACIQCSEGSCKRTFHVSCAHANSSYSLAFEINPVKTSRRDQVATAAFKAEQGHWSALAFCKTHKELAKEKQTYDFYEVDPKTGLTALQTYVRSHKKVGGVATAHGSGATGTFGGIGAASAHGTGCDSTYALLRRAKRFDAVFGEFEGQASKYVRHHSVGSPASRTTAPGAAVNGVAEPLSGEGTSQSRRRQSAAAERPSRPHSAQKHREKPRHCVRCKTAWSPFWWTVPSPPAIEQPPAGAENVDVGLNTSEPLVCCNVCRFSLGLTEDADQADSSMRTSVKAGSNKGSVAGDNAVAARDSRGVVTV